MGGVLALLVSYLLLDGGVAPAWEADAFHAINGLSDWLDPPIRAVMLLGTLLAIPACALVAAAFRRWGLAIGLIAAGATGQFLSKVIKDAVERGRPADLLEDVVLRGSPAHGFGYASGHTSVAFSLAACAMWALDGIWRVVVLALAAIVGLARIYVGAHMPLDVLGGAALGLVVGTLVSMALPPDRTE